MGCFGDWLWDSPLNSHKEIKMEETQETLMSYDKNLKAEKFRLVVKLKPNPKSLEQEKEKLIQNLCDFIEPLNLEQLQVMGRPRADFKDIIKSFCIMSYHGMSYRRAEKDSR